jgi:hypothetical protein
MNFTDGFWIGDKFYKATRTGEGKDSKTVFFLVTF